MSVVVEKHVLHVPKKNYIQICQIKEINSHERHFSKTLKALREKLMECWNDAQVLEWRWFKCIFSKKNLFIAHVSNFSYNTNFLTRHWNWFFHVSSQHAVLCELGRAENNVRNEFCDSNLCGEVDGRRMRKKINCIGT